jgi:hypothetical protein
MFWDNGIKYIRFFCRYSFAVAWDEMTWRGPQVRRERKERIYVDG